MRSFARLALASAITGTAASLATFAATALAAMAKGDTPWHPVNATSHWLHGRKAGRAKALDVRHTLVGALTHQGSSMFWALIFESWLASRRRVDPLTVMRDAVGMAAVAAAVDYGVMPKRLTPGWEHALPVRSIVATYAALAVGLAAGAILVREMELD